VFGPFFGGVLTVIASNASAALSFLTSRYLARAKAEQLVHHYPTLNAVYRDLGNRGGWKVVAAVRISHALPFGVQNFLLGLTPIRFRAYLLTTVAVTLPGIFMIAYLGYIGAITLTPGDDGEPLTGPQWLARAAGLVGVALALAYLGYVVRRAIKKRIADDQPQDASGE
jgi:uncharacterized membrane protein YdjX (TVP38/TMEM64 family)